MALLAISCLHSCATLVVFVAIWDISYVAIAFSLVESKVQPVLSFYILFVIGILGINNLFVVGIFASNAFLVLVILRAVRFEHEVIDTGGRVMAKSLVAITLQALSVFVVDLASGYSSRLIVGDAFAKLVIRGQHQSVGGRLSG